MAPSKTDAPDPGRLLAGARPELVQCRRWEQSATWSLDKRLIPLPVLWLVEAGSATIEIEGAVHEAGPGAIVFLSPGAVVSAQPGAAGPPTILSLNFHLWIYGGQEAFHLVRLPTLPDVVDPGAVWSIARRLVDVEHRFPNTHPLVSSAAIGEIVAHLLERNVAPTDLLPPHPSIAAALAHIHQNIDKPLNIEDVAATAGMSPSHLRTLFGRSLGISPREYVQRTRYTLACELLADPLRSVADVAFAVGFSDPGYFTRWFTARAGEPPSLARKRFVL